MAAGARYNLAMPFKAAASDLLHFLTAALKLGAVPASGEYLKYDGSNIVGGTPGGGGGTPTPTAAGDVIESTDGSTWAKRTAAQFISDLALLTTTVAATLYQILGTWRSTSAGTDTLTAADGTVEYGASCTVTMPAASTCKVGQSFRLIGSAAGVVLTLRRAGADTLDGGVSDVVVTLPTARGVCGVVVQTASALGSVQPGALTTSQATRAVISVSGGAWTCSLQAKNAAGTYTQVGTVAVEAELVGGEVTFSGTTVTLVTGATATTTPSAAPSKWRIPISSLTGFDNASIKSLMSVQILPGTIPAQISQYLWLAFATPAGAFDATSKNKLGVQIGRGAANPATRRATTTGTWTSIVASDASLTRLLFHYRPGMSSMTILSCDNLTPPPTQEQATTSDATTPTHIYFGLATSTTTVADATYTAPTITIDWTGG